MQEDQIKEAFYKVKEDIFAIKDAINILSDEISIIKRTLDQTHNQTRQTDRQITQTVPQEIGGLNQSNSTTSTGNEGVQTDRQTHQQTDRHIEKQREIPFTENQNPPVSQKFALIPTPKEDQIMQIDKVSEVLDSLDAIKKDLRAKFKRLTPQEMLVFSAIYSLQDDQFTVDYSTLSTKTGLSESAIRDYVLKLVKKGVPIDKNKENNKRIILSIPQNFRRMASLKTILQLRNL